MQVGLPGLAAHFLATSQGLLCSSNYQTACAQALLLLDLSPATAPAAPAPAAARGALTRGARTRGASARGP